MKIQNILLNVLLSAVGSGIWALVGWLYWKHLRKSREEAAYISLYSGLDRLRDQILAIEKYIKRPDGNDIKQLEVYEKYLERYVDAVDYSFITLHLPYKSCGNEVVWIHDLNFILDNSREMVNEIFTLRTEIAQRDTTYKANRDSLLKVMEGVLSAIEGEIQLIPEKIRNHGVVMDGS